VSEQTHRLRDTQTREINFLKYASASLSVILFAGKHLEHLECSEQRLSPGVCPKEEHRHATSTDPVHSGLAGRLPVRLQFSDVH
jgi:hypothetical protein